MNEVGVTVVYAQAEGATLIELRLPAGATVADAISRSGILGRHPELDAKRLRVGIFGSLTAQSAALADGDRVELYRPLIVDAKEARRRRVKPRVG
jgi:putative ubiquitin-RnfH superfamily antitoxin RatB of RatAB toxin-antitoxin module